MHTSVIAALVCGLFIYLDNEEKEIHIDVSLVEMSESDFEKPDAPPLVALPAATRAAIPAPKSLDLPEAPALEEAREPKTSSEGALEPEEIELPELDKPIFEELSVEALPVEEIASVAPDQASILAPKAELLSPLKPKYPRSSRKRGEEGVVQVEVEVNSEGKVDSAAIHASSGFAALDEAALEAVKSARFTKVKAKIFLSVDFRLR